MTGVAASAWLGWLWADGAASCAIGLLLVADAFVILSATRSFITGESVAPPFLRDFEIAAAGSECDAVAKIETLHLGPESVLVALTLRDGYRAEPEVAELSRRLNAADRRVAHVVVRCHPPPLDICPAG